MLSDRDIEKARKAEAAAGPRITSARFSRATRKLTVEFENRWAVVIPAEDIAKFGALEQEPSDAELAKVEVWGDGRYIDFPRIDATLYGPYIVRGVMGEEAWRAQGAKAMGSRKTAAKAAASRENGKKGGRPRKEPTATAAKRASHAPA